MREVVGHPGAVAMVAHDERFLYLVRQPREAVGEDDLLELPAGKLDVPGESPVECAKRELAEEVGKAASQWRELKRFYTSPGFAEEEVTVFLATELQDAEAESDEDERLEVVAWPLEDLDRAIEECRDAKSLIGLLLFKELRRAGAIAGLHRLQGKGAKGRIEQAGMAIAIEQAKSARTRVEARFEALVLDFLAHLEFERGLARNTLTAYRTDLLQYGAFLAERDRGATEAERADVADFLADLATGERTPRLLAGDDQPQGRLPAVLLPAPAARGADRRRPDRDAGAAAQEPQAPPRARLRRGEAAAGERRRIATRSHFATARCSR